MGIDNSVINSHAAADLLPEERAARREIRRMLYREHPELTAKQRKAIARGGVALSEVLELKAAPVMEAEAWR